MTKGICLLCFGDSSFGKLTYNLVASIKQYGDINVTIFTDNDSLIDVDKSIFDNILEIPKDTFYLKNRGHPNRFKMCLYDITPYDYTMYLDVDSIYTKNVSIEYLFDLLNSDLDIVAQNEKIVNLDETTKIFHGYDVSVFEPKFKFTKSLLHQIHGQFLLFKKNERTRMFFDVSKEIYDKMDSNEIVNYCQWSWFGRPIEELTMTIATGLVDINIYNNFAPVSVQSQNLEYDEIINNKWFISICGSSTKELAEKIGGYCQDEMCFKKYVDHYNRRVIDIKNFKCYNYVEKVYKL